VIGGKIIRNWSLLTVSNIVQQGLGFLVLIPIARALELSEYGTFTLILTAVGIAQIFSSLAARMVVIREVARNGNNLPQIARRTFYLALFGFFGAAAPLIAYLRIGEEIADPALLSLSALLLLSQILWNYAEPLTFGKEQMQFSSIIGSAFAVLWAGLIFLAPGLILDLASLLTCYALSQFARSAVYVFFIWRADYFKEKADSPPESAIGYRGLLSQSLPLYFSGLLNVSITQLPILFLAAHSGSVEVAYYGLGSKLSLPFILVCTNLVNAIYPLLSRLYREGDAASFARRLKMLFTAVWFAGIGFSFILSIFSVDIISIVFGSKFEAASPVFAMLLWVTLNHLIHSCMGLVFLAADKEKLMVKLSVFNGLVTGLAAYAGSFHGATGLALGTFIGLSLSYLVHWHYVQALARIPIRGLILYGCYAAYLVLGLGSLYSSHFGMAVKSGALFIALMGLWTVYSRNRFLISGIFKPSR
jgi:O-antigen/teichoic acid export membrane protein